MNSRLLLCAFALSASPIFAADPTPAPSSTATNRANFTPPIVSPEIHADRSVTFRLRATNAHEVVVSGEFGANKLMTKSADGVWSATVGPLAPELYGYTFAVDGQRMIDPANPAIKPSRQPTTSILEIPGNPPLPHDFTDVPHGTVREHVYDSKSLGRLRSLRVYTPPGYDHHRAEYPTLYLFHGSGDNDATWVALGHAHLILDQLIAQKKAKPMVVVMTDGHALPPGAPGSGGGGSGATNALNRNLEAFQKDLLESVIPFVETNYRVARKPAQRAIVGLSMGGGQSLNIGLNHPELFSWVGGFSSSIPAPQTSLTNLLAKPDQANKQYRLIWIACGKDDRLVEQARKLDSLLHEKGIRHQFLETEGNHSWPVWRKYLAQFAPLLFVSK